jgi:GNAT superfamily N-acetyltransferase
MQKQELAQCIDWADQEGWNPGLHDSETFFAADPHGFLLAELDGKPVGMISCVRYGASFGFIGFYIVVPAFRGRGYGLALWNAALAQLGGRLIGLDGVVAQQANYRKSGFVWAYNNLRMQGVTGSMGPDSEGIVALETVHPEHLVQYDAGMFPVERATFVRHWVRQPGSIALGLQQHTSLRGYGVIRPCRVGFKIGPLFADDAMAASDLLNALMSRVPVGQPVQWDISACCQPAHELARAWGMQAVFETARMYTGVAPAFDLQRQYGVTTFELG